MSYALDAVTVRDLCATALAGHPSANRFVALALGPNDPMADVARTVERTVFEVSFAMDHDVMVAEYTAYEAQSFFFLVLDRETGMPAGAARAIDGGGKTLDDAPAAIGHDLSEIVRRHGLHDGRIWDYATLAVLPEYRASRDSLTVSGLLYRTFINAGRRAGVKHVVCMLDAGAYRNLTMLGVRFIPMAGSEPFEYLGSAAKPRPVYPPRRYRPLDGRRGAAPEPARHRRRHRPPPPGPAPRHRPPGQPGLHRRRPRRAHRDARPRAPPPPALVPGGCRGASLGDFRGNRPVRY